MYEPRPLIIPAEFADRVDDLIHLPERHSVHQLVELMEVMFELVIVHRIGFGKSLIEHRQNGIAIAEAGRMGFNVRFQDSINVEQDNTPKKFL